MISRGKEGAFRPAIRWGLGERGAVLPRTHRLKRGLSSSQRMFDMSLANNDFVEAAAAGGELAMVLIELQQFHEAAELLYPLLHKIQDRKVRVNLAIGRVYVTLAKLSLQRLASGSGDRLAARRACDDVDKISRFFVGVRSAALRLNGRLHSFPVDPVEQSEPSGKASAIAQKLSANYEVPLRPQKVNPLKRPVDTSL